MICTCKTPLTQLVWILYCIPHSPRYQIQKHNSPSPREDLAKSASSEYVFQRAIQVRRVGARSKPHDWWFACGNDALKWIHDTCEIREKTLPSPKVGWFIRTFARKLCFTVSPSRVGVVNKMKIWLATDVVSVKFHRKHMLEKGNCSLNNLSL